MRDRRPPMKQAVSVGALLSGLLHQRGFDGKLREYEAWRVWDEVVGPQIARRARPSRIREGVLEVRVDQPVWMQQLQLMKPKILARLNERLGGEVIRDIFWRRGRIDPDEVKSPGSEADLRSIPLTPEDQEQIERALQDVEDPELHRQMVRLYTRQIQLQKKKYQP